MSKPLQLAIGFLLLNAGFALASATAVSPLMCSDPGSTTASSGASTITANSCTDFSYQYPNSVQSASGTNNWLYGYYPGLLSPTAFTPMTQATDPSGNNAGWWAVNFDRYWTSLDAFGGHPNGIYTDYHFPPYCDPVQYQNCSAVGGPDPRSPDSPGSANQDAVRRYVVPAGVGSTAVAISIQVQKDPRTADPGAQGTTEYVIVYSGGVATTLITLPVPVNFDPNIQGAPATSDGLPQPIYSASTTFMVNSGDFIDFVIAPYVDPGRGNQTVDYSSGIFELATIQSVAPTLNTSIPEAATSLLVGIGLIIVGLLRRRPRKV